MIKLFVFMVIAPVPKNLPVTEIAPPPRPMYQYVDDNGNIKYYAREYFDENGVRRKIIREGDVELEKKFYPIFPNGKVLPER